MSECDGSCYCHVRLGAPYCVFRAVTIMMYPSYNSLKGMDSPATTIYCSQHTKRGTPVFLSIYLLTLLLSLSFYLFMGCIIYVLSQISSLSSLSILGDIIEHMHSKQTGTVDQVGEAEGKNKLCRIKEYWKGIGIHANIKNNS